ncbi:formylglycine-generating enzyme family protein [Floridanema aerugineum]|uniref:Formylglycine-generating enzyme family protein n=1 Tax=Floridaenema aerugineum BLCC-F46 TaxID=3153654 RepID=A0ABV4X9X1_9CYAN
MPKIVISYLQHEAEYFVEDLGAGVELDMVLIPGGSFMMGSPEYELGRSDNESPQHLVTIKPFFIGKYPITQAQWKAIAELSPIKQELNLDPSHFKGSNRPVERISWLDAVEFCDRLTEKTKRKYRLPSEAEWEYACRAGTTTPFHFGETITTDLANYNGTNDKIGSYGRGPKGIYRQETTPVGTFKVANAFGLFDMHGNVWEWCADHWHNNYEGAPDDGSAWVEEQQNDRDNDYHFEKVRRGSSWYSYPDYCRSACRVGNAPGHKSGNGGFRVVCTAG